MSATTRVERLEKQMPVTADSFWADLLAAVAKNGQRLVNLTGSPVERYGHDTHPFDRNGLRK